MGDADRFILELVRMGNADLFDQDLTRQEDVDWPELDLIRTGVRYNLVFSEPHGGNAVRFTLELFSKSVQDGFFGNAQMENKDQRKYKNPAPAKIIRRLSGSQASPSARGPMPKPRHAGARAPGGERRRNGTANSPDRKRPLILARRNHIVASEPKH